MRQSSGTSPKSSTKSTTLIDPTRWGVSFSVKQCRDFKLDPAETLDWLLSQGFRRFRLMSYWNEHEPEQGKPDFGTLDKQIEQIAKAGGTITLCLGARQPRWPENHWPEWAWQAPKQERTTALLKYLEIVVNRYKGNAAIVSYQLENEALLKNFGERPEVDRKRLRQEFKLVKKLDPTRPVIMTTSTAWGIPLRRPIPDMVGFSFYQVVYVLEKYVVTPRWVFVDWLRSAFIRILWRRRSFIHELQMEPWGPQAIWEMSREEQDKSMHAGQMQDNFLRAQATGLNPIDLWGGEWWYWRFKQGDKSVWNNVRSSLLQ